MKRRSIKKDRATSTLLSDWINNRARHYRLFSLPLLCAFAITCSNEPNILEQVKEKGELHVITLNSPTTYYQDEDTMALKVFNDKLAKDSRLEIILLPVRDGLMVARKKEEVE